MTAWFETAGERGMLEIERRDGSWYVAEQPTGSAVKCLGDSFGTGMDDLPERQRIRGTVSSYKRGEGSRPDVLFLTDVQAAPDGEAGSGPTAEALPDTEAGPGTETEGELAEEASSTPSLERIARERIGDYEVRQADGASLVAGAQRRASKQHRDPAIDPRLQDERNRIQERN